MINKTLILALVYNSVKGIKTNEQLSQKAQESKSVASTMTDEDAKCYTDRYPIDINSTVDPRQHFDNIGKEQGRLSTCSKELTAFESQRYLDRNPSLQRKIGRGGAGGPALQLANQHFMEIGFKDPSFISGRDEYTEPWYCGATEFSNCGCKGTMHMGPLNRPDSNETIKKFDEMRYWKTISKESSDWTMCSSVGMGGDPWPEAAKQCWCEPAPQYESTPCADEGEACLCNGYVAYGAKNNKDNQKKIANLQEMTAFPYAINDANNTKSIQCVSSSFEMVDPIPNGKKQCFCDEQKKFFNVDNVQWTKQNWRSYMMQSSMTVVLETASSIESKADTQLSIVKTTTASKETQEIKLEKGEEENTCGTCEIDKAKQQESKEKKKLEEERVDAEKSETIQKEKAEREQQEAIRRKKEAETLKAAAEKAENSREKAMMEEESRRMKAEAERLEAIALIEREKIQREQEIRRQSEIRRLQQIETERRHSEEIINENLRKEQIIIRQRRAEIERTRIIEEKKLIEQKVEAEIVKQKSITQIEQSLVQSETIIEQQIQNARQMQIKRERQIRHLHEGTKKLEEIAEEEVKAVTQAYETEKISKNEKMSKSYITLNNVKEEQNLIVTQKTKESSEHKKIKEEAMNSTIVLNRRKEQVQQNLLSTSSGGATSGQSKGLENELKQIESEIEINTKISELESKSESKTQNEADAANSKIFNQEEIVRKVVEEVSIINDKTEYAQAQKEVILEQKDEEKYEKEMVTIEVEAFKANQTALSEQSTLEEMATESQQLAIANSTAYTVFGKQKATVTKNMSNRTQSIEKIQKELASTTVVAEKEKMQKEITTLTTENDRDNNMLIEQEKDLKNQEVQVKESEQITKKQEKVAKKAEQDAIEVEKKVSAAEDTIIKNSAKKIEVKKIEQKKQEDKLEADKKKLVEVDTAENSAIEKAKKNMAGSEKIILDSKQELNKLKGQKNKLIQKRNDAKTKPEKQEIDTQVQALDTQSMTFIQTIDAEDSKKKIESKNLAISSEKIEAQKLVVKSQSHSVKTAQELTASTENSSMSSTSVMISSSKSSGKSSTSSTSTTTRTFSKRVHNRIKAQKKAAKEKRAVSQRAYQQYRVNFRVRKQRKVDLKRRYDSYTISLEEHKSSLVMFQIQAQELQNRIKSTSNDTVKTRYQGELDTLDKEKEKTIKLIETDKKDREGIKQQLEKVKKEIHTGRANIQSLKLDAKKTEDMVVQSIMSQTGSESVSEKKKIQAQQKQEESEKNEKNVAEQKDITQEKITAMNTKLAAHKLNEQESQEVIESLKKRKSSVEADSSTGNQEQIIKTITSEIETEKGRFEEEKKNKEVLDTEIQKLTDKTKLEIRKANTTKDEAKKAYDEAVEAGEETESSKSTDAQENAFKEEATAKDEQRLAIEDEISEIKLIAESSKQSEIATISKIELNIKASEVKQTEAVTIIDSLYKEINAAKTQMSVNNTKSADIVQLQADISAREKKIDDQKDIVRISMEEKRKAETEEKLIKESIQEGEMEITNMTAQVKTIQAESDGAKQQAIDYLESQKKVDEEKIKKMATLEIYAQQNVARLEKQLLETKEKTIEMKAEQVTAMQSLPAAELALAQAQKQAKKSEEDSLIATCTKLYVEKRELFTAADKATTSGTCGVSSIQSCLSCGTGSTGVTQITVQISNMALIDSLVDGLFEKTLVADIEEVSGVKKTSSVNGEKKTTSAPAGTKLVMVTSDLRSAELLEVINVWSTRNDNAAGDVIATPLKYGKQDYFDFVKEATKKKTIDFKNKKQLTQEQQPTYQRSSLAAAEAQSIEPFNFSYVQMGKNEGVVSQLVKKISH